MYKTAPRYLSGVSVFYGDDITRRTVTGEIAFFLGQSIKGPTLPVVLSSIDAAVLLYGKNSPILKAIYEFWDGYIDSPKSQNIQLVTLRVGGKQAVLATPFGITLTTSDAYNNIEDDYYVFINSSVGSQVVKVWDKNKQKVLDTVSGINTGHISVSGTFTGSLETTYGKDIDEDPYDTHYTIKTVLDPAANSMDYGFTQSAPFTNSDIAYSDATDTSTIALTVTGSKDGIDLQGGWVVAKSVNSALTDVQYLKYTSVAISGNTCTFTVPGSVVVNASPYVTTGYISGFGLTEGDSELTTDPREKYELFRNALAEIEQYTPDYIVPAGIYFNETDEFNKLISHTTTLSSQPAIDSTTMQVDGAAQWLSSGNVDLYDGTFTNQLIYTAKAVNGVNYTITLDDVSDAGLVVTAPAASGEADFSVTGTNADLARLRNSGYLKVGSATVKYTNVFIGSGQAMVTRDITFGGGAEILAASASVTKTIGTVGTGYAGYIVTHSYLTPAKRELGIGYVRETDIGGSYTFEWSDTQRANYNLAHFGYLLANFCSESAIGSNTPICGMNVDISDVAAANFSRNSIVQWIGTIPSYANVAGTDAVSAVLGSGTGLLGDSVMAGSANYNRANLGDPTNGTYADPGLGLMLTSEGAVDGTIARDNFGVLVDLGKFMVVGAGLLTFSNGASITSYIDSCGIYSLGMLSGMPSNQGLSFARIGQTSNTSVTVVVHRKYYNDLARMKYIVPTRERGLGWVINNGDSAARTDSQYKLISTTRIIKTIVERKRALLSSFIGKALNQYYYEAAKTKLADSFKSDVADGLINGFTFDLQIEDVAAAIGKLYLKIAINPPFELTQVTIDTVIDRSVTNSK